MTELLRPAVLVTGGAGYIGAHTAKALYESGFNPVVYDDLSSGFAEAVQWGPLIRATISDEACLRAAFRDHAISAVIHFAGLIEVGRSNTAPDVFWDVNVSGTRALLSAMAACAIPRLVFSSSAAVYGQGSRGPLETIDEAQPKAPASPYGDTKLAAEWMIAAQCRAYGLSAIALRYFNAAGADPSGAIGEAHEPESHLIPLAIAAALGDGAPLTVFGDDFETPDGTGLRDYIHVSDLAAAHVAALRTALPPQSFEAFNVGTGQGVSVRAVIEAVSRAVGRATPHAIGPRRAGDPASLVANPARAAHGLAWTPRSSSLAQIVADALRWERRPQYGAGLRSARRARPLNKVAGPAAARRTA